MVIEEPRNTRKIFSRVEHVEESSWRVELELENGGLGSRVEHVDRVEIFKSDLNYHSQGKSANQLAHLKSFDNQVSAIHSQGAWA